MPKPITEVGKARAAMKSLGVYKPEFEPVIHVYAGLREQYVELTKQYEKSGYEFSEDTAAGSKKAPIVTTLESLRKDILAYASQLGLTPQGLLKANDKAFAAPKSSVLSKAIKDAGK